MALCERSLQCLALDSFPCSVARSVLPSVGSPDDGVCDLGREVFALGYRPKTCHAFLNLPLDFGAFFAGGTLARTPNRSADQTVFLCPLHLLLVLPTGEGQRSVLRHLFPYGSPPLGFPLEALPPFPFRAYEQPSHVKSRAGLQVLPQL